MSVDYCLFYIFENKSKLKVGIFNIELFYYICYDLVKVNGLYLFKIVKYFKAIDVIVLPL